MEEVFAQAREVEAGRGSETMLAPQEVQRMLALRALGWGAKRISAELGCSRNTVREYLRRGGWKAMDVSRRASVVEPHRGGLGSGPREPPSWSRTASGWRSDCADTAATPTSCARTSSASSASRSVFAPC